MNISLDLKLQRAVYILITELTVQLNIIEHGVRYPINIQPAHNIKLLIEKVPSCAQLGNVNSILIDSIIHHGVELVTYD